MTTIINKEMENNYKQIKLLQPSGKMEVTPEQSQVLQKSLFDIGKEWVFDESRLEINCLDKPFIFWDEEGKLITTLDAKDKALFIEDENPLHIFLDYFEKY